MRTTFYNYTLIITLLLLFQKGISQNIDSLLGIWQQETALPSVRLNAIYTVLSDRNFYSTNIEKADSLAIEQYNFAKKYGNKTDVIHALTNRSLLAIHQQNYEEGLALAQEGLAINQDNEEHINISKIWRVKGYALQKMGLEKEAIIEFKKILSLDDLSDFDRWAVYNYITNSYSTIGEFSKAIDACKTAYQYLGDDNCNKFHHYNNMAVVYYRMEDIRGAIENFNKAIVHQQLCNQEGALALPLANLASAHAQLKEYDKAKIYFDSSSVLATKYNNEFILIRNKIELAKLYTDQGFLEKAEKLNSEIIQILPTIKDYGVIGNFYYYYGKFKLAQQQYGAAFEACKIGFDMFSEKNFLSRKKLCAKCLYQVSEKRQDSENALKWFKTYSIINDSLLTKDAMEKASRMQFENKYLAEKNAYEKNILALEFNAQQEKKNKQFLLLLLAGIILGSIALGFVYRSEKNKSALLEENLESKALIAEQAEKLQEQERLKTDFFANISHEFQTPLSIISGQSNNLLSNEQISQKDRLALSSIVRNSSNLLNLTEQILIGTKSNNWNTKLEVERFYLYEILNPIIEEFKTIATEKKLQLSCKYHETEEILLITDANKLQTIISNILSNAFRYSSYEGVITVNCREIDNQLQLEFGDNGIGIPMDKLSFIFDRFVQVTSSDNIKEHQGGFGLGLSICRDYAQLIDGTITVESTLGVGSNFCLTIPKVLDQTKYTQAKLEKSNYLPNHPSSQPIPNTIVTLATLPTILIAEDNKDIWLYLQNLLEGKYNLVFTSNGREALNYLEKSPLPNLIITDLMMPYMDGYSLIENLRNNPTFNFIPILVLTARNDVGEKVSGLYLNRDDYLIKPFDNTIFTARVDYLVGLSQNRLEDIMESSHKKTTISTKEEEWLKKVEEVVKTHLSDINFTSATLAEEIKLSQIHLNRKLKALIGFTSSKYILEARLRKALELLETGAVISVKEACYSVGFKIPKYFSRNFKERFGKNPSEFIK